MSALFRTFLAALLACAAAYAAAQSYPAKAVHIVVPFPPVGAADLLLDYYHAVQGDLPSVAGELGAAYMIPIVYVPLLMITHVAAFYLLLRRQPKAVLTVASRA